MFSKRTKLTLAQLLSQQPFPELAVLFSKHDVSCSAPYGSGPANALQPVSSAMLSASPEEFLAVLEEVVRLRGQFRANVSPKYLFDGRFEDLRRCLELDGFVIEESNWPTSVLKPIEPSIDGSAPLEDDLAIALKSTGLPNAAAIKKLLDDSTADFLKNPPDLNGCLTNSRVALQTLATAIGEARADPSWVDVDKSKWGSVLLHLRQSDFITVDEEHGLAGVFRFDSPGAHKPIGLNEREMTRLGRNLAVSMCYFLVKRHLG